MISLLCAGSDFNGGTANDIKLATGGQLLSQGCAGAEVHIGVGKLAARVGIYIGGDVDNIADFDGGDCLHVEHGVVGSLPLLGYIQFSADVLLVHRGGGVAHGGRHRRRCLGGLRLIGGGFRGNGTRLRVFGRSNRGGGVRLRAVAGSCGVGLRLGGWIRGVRCRLGLADGHVGAVILRCKGGGNVAHQQTEHQQQRQNSGTDFVHKKCPPIKFSMGISQ